MSLSSERNYVSHLIQMAKKSSDRNLLQSEGHRNALQIIRNTFRKIADSIDAPDLENYQYTEPEEVSFEHFLFIKFGLTYHLQQGKDRMSPISSVGSIENTINPDDETENYVNARYSRSTSSPY